MAAPVALAPSTSNRRDAFARLGQLIFFAAALISVALAAYHPHYNIVADERFPYPVHMDEYVHWGYAQAIQKSESLKFTEPFTGDTWGDRNLGAMLHEHGYWVLHAIFQGATGLQWLAIYQYGPTVVALFLALAVYCLAEREKNGAGVWAAAFVACIPTTLRFLGPGFLVPIVFSLPFVAGVMLLTFHYRQKGVLPLLAAMCAAVWPLHVMGGLAATLAVVFHAVASINFSWKRALGLLFVGISPFLASWNYYSWMFERRGDIENALPVDTGVFKLAGSIVLVLAGIGLLATLFRRREGLARGITFALLLSFFATAIYLRVDWDLDLFRLYDRSHMIVFLLAAILAGIGLQALLHAASLAVSRLARVRIPTAATRVGFPMLGVLVVAFAVANSVVAQSEQSYYRMLDAQYYDDLSWIRENVDETYSKALVPTPRTLAFSVVTGRPTAFVVYPGSPSELPDEVIDFYRGGGRDTAYLVRQGVTLVYSDRPLTNPDLIEIPPRLYLLREDYAERIAGQVRTDR